MADTSQQPDTSRAPAPDPVEENAATVERNRAAQIAGGRPDRPSVFTCPDCGGTLWQLDQPELVQFRCHVGHVLTGEALLAGQAQAAENALWYAIRVLTDRMVLARELAEVARRMGEAEAAAGFEALAEAAERQAQALRQVAEAPPGAGTRGDRLLTF